MPNTPEAVISFYALNKIGVVANMIHPLSAAADGIVLRSINSYNDISRGYSRCALTPS